MFFDVKRAVSEVLRGVSDTAIPAIPAIRPVLDSGNSGDSSPLPTGNVSRAPPETAPKVYSKHGYSLSGDPLSWTGRSVSSEEWQSLSDWDRDGPDGRYFCGKCRQWVAPDDACYGERPCDRMDEA